MDNQENIGISNDELQLKKEKIAEGLKKLKERTIKYYTLQQLLAAFNRAFISWPLAKTKA